MRKGGIGVLVGALGLASCAVAYAQGAPLAITVVSPPVRPGTPVFLNAMFSNAAGAPVAELRQTFAFPHERLVFARARLGIAGSLADAVLDVEMRDAVGAPVTANDAAARLQLRITARKPIPDGPLVELEFRLVEASQQTIRIVHTAEAVGRDGAPLPGLAYSDVELEVTEDVGAAPPAVFACFFYMH